MSKSVYYVKCRPQDCNAWPIAKKYKRVFIGYPVPRSNVPNTKVKSGLSKYFLNLSQETPSTDICSRYTPGYLKMVAQHKNLISSIHIGDFVIVPRPADGVCHISQINSEFEFIDSPKWAEDYLKLRTSNNLDITPYAGVLADVIQTWSVAKWKTVSFPLFPRWISYRFLSRNQIGRINSLPNNLGEPFKILEELYKNGVYKIFRDKDDLIWIKRNLLTWVSPNQFEHLVINLLQLESKPGTTWHHVGGSGDGGVDGLQLNQDNKVIGAVQCKWKFSESFSKIEDWLSNQVKSNNWEKAYLATLFPSQKYFASTDIVEHWGLDHIARLLKKHAKKVPFAKTISGLFDN